MQLRRIAIVAWIGLLAGCGSDEKIGPGGIVSGSFSFNFAGGISGTYSSSGSFPSNASQEPTTEWAAGEVVTADGETWVASSVPVNSTLRNYVFIVAPRVTAGSSTITSSCTGSGCADMGFFFRVPGSNFLSAEQTCFLTSGTITFASISSTRAVGTFSGTGNCVTPSSVTTSFTVTGGTFDVPLVAGIA